MTFEQGLAISVPMLALVGVVVTYIGQRILKSNAELSADIAKQNAELSVSLQSKTKLAEFRQNWIDGLRQDMSHFHALGITPNLQPVEFKEFHELRCRIQLRINKNDQDYERLCDSMLNIYLADGQQDKINATPEYVEVCQDILKREWDTLKADLQEIDFTVSVT